MKMMQEYVKEWKRNSVYLCKKSNNRNIHDVQDAMGEALLRILEKGYSFENLLHFKSMMGRMVVNILIDNHRKKKETLEENIEPSFEMNVSGNINLFKQLRKMKDKDKKKAMILKAYGFKYKDIGEMLNTSETAVRINVCRAKKILRKKWNIH